MGRKAVHYSTRHADIALAVMAVLLLVEVGGCQSDHMGSKVDHVESKPMTPFQKIHASDEGFFVKGYRWELDITADDRPGRLRIFKPETAERRIILSVEDIERLNEGVALAKFSKLPPRIGEMVPDCDTKTITIEAAGESKTVTILYIQTGDTDPSIGPALRLWSTIRSMFDDPDAVD